MNNFLIPAGGKMLCQVINGGDNTDTRNQDFPVASRKFIQVRISQKACPFLF
jgi:hypothetical protein